jgi:hypothetical protein
MAVNHLSTLQCDKQEYDTKEEGVVLIVVINGNVYSALQYQYFIFLRGKIEGSKLTIKI